MLHAVLFSTVLDMGNVRNHNGKREERLQLTTCRPATEEKCNVHVGNFIQMQRRTYTELNQNRERDDRNKGMQRGDMERENARVIDRERKKTGMTEHST